MWRMRCIAGYVSLHSVCYFSKALGERICMVTTSFLFFSYLYYVDFMKKKFFYFHAVQ